MNKSDSSLIRHILEKQGYESVDNADTADIFIVNTCSVRSHAETRALGYISSLKKWRTDHGRVLCVVGCMAKRLADDIALNHPYVDLILGPDSYRNIAELINQTRTQNTKIIETKISGELYCGIYPKTGKISNFVSVTRGCDNYCSYCVVPYLRGRMRSRPAQDIANEIESLIQGGTKDITLLGQNVNEYSFDNIGFAELLNMAAGIPGLFRLRFLTSHPKDLDDKTITAVKENKNICEWFHLPLQSGNNRILALMSRKYTKETYIDLIEKIRSEIPHASITTDIIVGFPTETEEEFLETLQVLEKIKFDDAYMYRYSARKGTKAFEYESLPEETIKKRLQELLDFQTKIANEKTKRMIGKTYEVLFESQAENGTRGKTRGNRDVIVGQDIKLGEVHKVIIKEVRGRTPIGQVV